MLRRHAARHPFTLLSLLLGAILGLFMGGVGIAAAGGAIGIPGFVIGGLIGAWLGWKIDRWRHRRGA